MISFAGYRWKLQIVWRETLIDYSTVFILDGNSEKVAYVWNKTGLSEIIIEIATDLDLRNCLKQIKLPISLNTCAPFPVLPPNMDYTTKLEFSHASKAFKYNQKYRIYYRVDRILPQICTASAQVNMKHALTQMQYRFAIVYLTLSTL